MSIGCSLEVEPLIRKLILSSEFQRISAEAQGRKAPYQAQIPRESELEFLETTREWPVQSRRVTPRFTSYCHCQKMVSQVDERMLQPSEA